ncbi:MAG: hypothetical protein ACFE9S_07725 [Candidatus Hermodarchaeota archaeon]
MAKPDGPPGKPENPGKPDHAGKPDQPGKSGGVIMPIIRDSTQEYLWATRERLTIDNTAAGIPFTASTYKPTTGDRKGICARIAKCVPEGADIRYRQDGTAPTSSVGRRIYEDSEFYIVGSKNIQNFKAIRTTSTSATLDVEYGW